MALHSAPVADEGYIKVISTERQIHSVKVRRGERNVLILAKLRSAFLAKTTGIATRFEHWHIMFLMKRPAIGWTSLGEGEAQDFERRRIGSQPIIHTRDDFLTRVLTETIQPNDSVHISDYLLDTVVISLDRKACVMYREIDRKLAAIWLLIALVASFSIGLATGLALRDASMGFNTGTCMLAVLSALQGILLLWQS